MLAHFRPADVSRSFRTWSASCPAMATDVIVFGRPSPKSRSTGPATCRRIAIVLRKPNIGYDFGSWAVGLECCRRSPKRRT